MPSATISKRLVVFDFDWTLIEADSDYWVVQHLGGDLAKQQKDLVEKMQWTDLQDMLLGQMHERGVTRQDLEKTLSKIPFTFGIDQLFSTIITNPAHFDKTGRLHIKRFLDLDQEPHHCPLPCHVNLCKGQELQKLIDQSAWDQVIYMGDSTNDFCPSTRLQSRDIVLARANLLLEENIKLHPEMLKAKVIYWESPKHALEIIQSIFNASTIA
ncbi:hypothetical protein EDD11_008117 [Mortierella claussenii]|nr:hypothetical protein EDD11_008117 [Mortierella claussenii]